MRSDNVWLVKVGKRKPHPMDAEWDPPRVLALGAVLAFRHNEAVRVLVRPKGAKRSRHVASFAAGTGKPEFLLALTDVLPDDCFDQLPRDKRGLGRAVGEWFAS